jgi:hypothetical protein
MVSYDVELQKGYEAVELASRLCEVRHPCSRLSVILTFTQHIMHPTRSVASRPPLA